MQAGIWCVTAVVTVSPHCIAGQDHQPPVTTTTWTKAICFAQNKNRVPGSYGLPHMASGWFNGLIPWLSDGHEILRCSTPIACHFVMLARFANTHQELLYTTRNNCCRLATAGYLLFL